MGASVLVVEDNAQLRKGLALLLRFNLHNAIEAGTLAEAVSQLPASEYTHVLLDLNMPDGTGVDLLQLIRGGNLPLRVAVLTGTSDAALLDEARALGVDAVFIKPPNWEKLLEWVALP